MFENIGDKIKQYTKIACIVCCMIWILFAIIIIVNAEESIWGIAFGIVMCLITWVMSFPMYGFGELISNSKKQNELLEIIIEQNNLSKKSGKNRIKEKKSVDAKNTLYTTILEKEQQILTGVDITSLPTIKKCRQCGAICNVNFEQCDCCGFKEFK